MLVRKQYIEQDVVEHEKWIIPPVCLVISAGIKSLSHLRN